MSRACGFCGESIMGRREGARYCSKRCKVHGRAAERPARACERCGRDYHPLKPSQRFCSHPCKIADAQPKAAAGARRALAGSGEGKTYRKLNGRHEHRVVAEQALGRPLRPGEVVHHIDGDILNNDPSNLQVLPNQAAHVRLHAELRKEVPHGAHIC